jgi:nucleotide-binding universal stress UspA family protein
MMTLIRQILCPVDLSDCSRAALEYAAALARAGQGRLTVLHVYSMLTAAHMPMLDGAPDRDVDPDRLTRDLEAFVLPVAAGLSIGLRVRRADDVRRAIIDDVNAVNADLLVLGSHGRSGFERLLLGSITERVVRKSPCAVLVVPPQSAPAYDGRFRQIVCGIDFSASSLQAFRYAVSTVAATGADVTLVHALEMPPELRDSQIVAAYDVEAIRAAAEAGTRARLQAIAAGEAASPVCVNAMVVEGRAHREILKIAGARNADLIVLGTHGRSAIDRCVFGSNTDGVLRGAPCPTLTVRA